MSPEFYAHRRCSTRCGTRRGLASRLGRPQGWVHNCECGNRRVDAAEFAAWARGCGATPEGPFAAFLAAAPAGET